MRLLLNEICCQINVADRIRHRVNSFSSEFAVEQIHDQTRSSSSGTAAESHVRRVIHARPTHYSRRGYAKIHKDLVVRSLARLQLACARIARSQNQSARNVRISEPSSFRGDPRLRITAAGGGERKQILITRRVYMIVAWSHLRLLSSRSPLSPSLIAVRSTSFRPLDFSLLLAFPLSQSLSVRSSSSSPRSLVSPCLPQP